MQFLLLLGLSLFVQNLFAQAGLPFDQKAEELYDIYRCKNKNGSIETLHIGDKKVIYFSSKFPQGVALELLNGENTDGIREEKGLLTRFPKGQAKYKLYADCFAFDCPIYCQNPDGSVQEFHNEDALTGYQGLFRCKNKDGSLEYLHLSASGTFYYRNGKQKSFSKLVVSELEQGDMGIFRACIVQFEGKKSKYKISSEYDEQTKTIYLQCINPDGSVQKFEWWNKYEIN